MEFHFNSAVAAAKGGEVHHQQIDADSMQFAQDMWAELASIGLTAHGSQPVKSTAVATRSGGIRSYAMTAIVLEPLFISNPVQASWLHANADKLASAIAAGIQGHYYSGEDWPLCRACLRIRQRFRRPACARGDHEADHTVTWSSVWPSCSSLEVHRCASPHHPRATPAVASRERGFHRRSLPHGSLRLEDGRVRCVLGGDFVKYGDPLSGNQFYTLKK